MTETFTLERILRIKLEQMKDLSFSISAFDSTRFPIEPEELISYLFFNDEQSFYGLLVEID